MLRNEIEKNEMFIQMSELVSPLGFKVVDAVRNESAAGVQLHLTVYCEDHEINTDDLAAVYNVVYPRYQVLLSVRDLTLEVSSPGLQRNFKDVYEFTLFKGKLVKVYSLRFSSHVEGVIRQAGDDSVELADACVMDTNEKFGSLVLPFEDIQKAKLTYRWEEKKKNGN